MAINIVPALFAISILILARLAGVSFAAWRHRHHISQRLWMGTVWVLVGLLFFVAYLLEHFY